MTLSMRAGLEPNQAGDVMVDRPLIGSWRDADVAGADPAEPGVSPLLPDALEQIDASLRRHTRGRS